MPRVLRTAPKRNSIIRLFRHSAQSLILLAAQEPYDRGNRFLPFTALLAASLSHSLPQVVSIHAFSDSNIVAVLKNFLRDFLEPIFPEQLCLVIQTSEYDRTKLQERLAKLSGSVAVTTLFDASGMASLFTTSQRCVVHAPEEKPAAPVSGMGGMGGMWGF